MVARDLPIPPTSAAGGFQQLPKSRHRGTRQSSHGLAWDPMNQRGLRGVRNGSPIRPIRVLLIRSPPRTSAAGSTRNRRTHRGAGCSKQSEQWELTKRKPKDWAKVQAELEQLKKDASCSDGRRMVPCNQASCPSKRRVFPKRHWHEGHRQCESFLAWIRFT
jgi:hypothetical protein